MNPKQLLLTIFMARKQVKRETKLHNLLVVMEFLNADFGSKSGKHGRWANYISRYLSLEQAREIQQRIIESHSCGSITPALHEVARKYATFVDLDLDQDGHAFKMLWDISQPGSDVVVSLINVTSITDDRFWRIARCSREACRRFFLPTRKRQYCSDDCVIKNSNEGAQKRVEDARRIHRYNEIKGQLFKLQRLGKRASLSDILRRLPGFKAELLADIIEGKRELKDVAQEIKYRNRKILMKAKI